MILDGSKQVADAIRDFGPEAAKEWRRLAFFERYFRGEHRRPYQPETATREFNELARRCVTNLMRLIVNTMTQRLVVDGFRSSSVATENAPQWQWWQDNGLDARQKALYDEAAKFGYAGVMVMPGDPSPVMRPVSPQEWWIGFEDHSDEWPRLALKQESEALWHVLDGRARYIVRTDRGGDVVITQEDVHDLGEVPIVPFRNTWNLTRYPEGEIEPAIAIQDRLNQTVFDLLVAQAYAAAPQKFVAGLVAPVDKATGKPIIDLTSFAASIWASSDKDTKFGSLPEANLQNIVHAIEQCLRVYGLMTQTPPHYLLGDLVNLSAEALLAADTTLAKKVGDRQTLFGESWEQVFRLAGVASGDAGAANDTAAQVWWRDTEPRSIAQQVDALGKLATMLEVPVQALWQEVPGMTGGTLELWKAEAARHKIELARMALRQQALGMAPTALGAPAVPAPGAGQPQPPPPGANIARAKAKGAA